MNSLRFSLTFCLLFSLTILFAQEKQISVTIYNDNLALVKDTRTLNLKAGLNEVAFRDISAQIDPTSVYFVSKSSPDNVKVLEQNFEYDLVSSNKLLQKYIDQRISFELEKGESVSGILMSASGADIIIKDEASKAIRLFKSSVIKSISFPELPKGLITKPTLVWKLDSKNAGSNRVEIGYLTSGISWHAEYVGVIDEKDELMEVGAWVSIENNSGTSYENAGLKLVAGDVNRAREYRRRYKGALTIEATSLAMADVPQFQEKAFFEYHVYTLQQKTTISNAQIKQISLFAPADVKVKKNYIYDGSRNGAKVTVKLKFKNDKKSGLGIPLPKGKFRVYKRDSDDSLILVGEDFLSHTPENQDVQVTVGNAFDVTGERIQKNRQSTGKQEWEATWEIKLKNQKKEAVKVIVQERLGVNWKIISKTHDFKKPDANTAEFIVDVPSGGEVVIEYTVRYKNR